MVLTQGILAQSPWSVVGLLYIYCTYTGYSGTVSFIWGRSPIFLCTYTGYSGTVPLICGRSPISLLYLHRVFWHSPLHLWQVCFCYIFTVLTQGILAQSPSSVAGLLYIYCTATSLWSAGSYSLYSYKSYSSHVLKGQIHTVLTGTFSQTLPILKSIDWGFTCQLHLQHHQCLWIHATLSWQWP